jgi:DUF1680 family protein
MSPPFDPNRRTLLKLGALAPACGVLLRGMPAMAGTVEAPLAELGYAQVQFDPGPLQTQAEQNHRLLLGLDEDSLLRPFRLRGGLPAPGQELGGWYDTWGFAPGATFGQWMSALARHYAITGDAATRAKLRRLVDGYAATVDPQGRFYRDNRFPSYIYDKLVGGLVDARRLAGDPTALDVLRRSTDAAEPYLPPHAVPRNEHARPGEDFSQHAWDESYTLPENQFLAYRLTGEARHRRLGQRFLYDDFFAPLAHGENVLPGKHAYSHVNALGSAAQAYLTLGQPMYLHAARHGLAMVEAQSFATGGWGPDEHFVAPDSDALAASLADQHKSFETPCGAYAHIKLTRKLLRITRDARYGDSMERVLYNTVLGAWPIEPDGHAFYYSDYTHDAGKSFHPDRWPCCSGTLPMVAADYRISACFTDPHGLYVNLYVPGSVRWTQDGAECRLRVRTGYPYASAIDLQLDVPSPRRFALRLRIPAWAEGASVRINGRRQDAPVVPGTFAVLAREWRPGDRVELELPLHTRLEPIDTRHPGTVALLAGPLVLMRVLGDGASEPVSRRAWLAARATTGSTPGWRLPDRPDIALRAFPNVGHERYRVYQQVPSA